MDCHHSKREEWEVIQFKSKPEFRKKFRRLQQFGNQLMSVIDRPTSVWSIIIYTTDVPKFKADVQSICNVPMCVLCIGKGLMSLHAWEPISQ